MQNTYWENQFRYFLLNKTVLKTERSAINNHSLYLTSPLVVGQPTPSHGTHGFALITVYYMEC